MDPQRRCAFLPFFTTECAVVVHSRPTLHEHGVNWVAIRHALGHGALAYPFAGFCMQKAIWSVFWLAESVSGHKLALCPISEPLFAINNVVIESEQCKVRRAAARLFCSKRLLKKPANQANGDGGVGFGADPLIAMVSRIQKAEWWPVTAGFAAAHSD